MKTEGWVILDALLSILVFLTGRTYKSFFFILLILLLHTFITLVVFKSDYGGSPSIIWSLVYAASLFSIIHYVASSAVRIEPPRYLREDDSAPPLFSIVLTSGEDQSLVMNTLRSITRHTPLGYEIFILDHGTGTPLQKNLADRDFGNRIKVLRFQDQHGIVRARIAAATLTTTDYLVFLEEGAVVSPGWAPPLLSSLRTHAVAVPEVWTVKGKDALGERQGIQGFMDWGLNPRWFHDDSHETPVIPTTVFATTKKWWEDSGQLDPSMFSGALHQIEFSLRTWMCGGNITTVPMSKVGYPRTINDYKASDAERAINVAKISKVWTDDYYANIVTTPSLANVDDGLGYRLALRRHLRCQGFSWYVDRFRTAFEQFGMLNKEAFYLRDDDSYMCLANVKNEAVLQPCSARHENQKWLSIAGGRLLRNVEGSCLTRTLGLEDCDVPKTISGSHPNLAWHLDDRGVLSRPPPEALISVTGREPLVVPNPTECLSSSIEWDQVLQVPISAALTVGGCEKATTFRKIWEAHV